MEKKWLILLVVLLAFGLIINLLYLNILYSISEARQESGKGELHEGRYTAETTYDCYDSYAMSLLNKLTPQGKECVDNNCDSYDDCLKKGEDFYDAGVEKYCDAPMNCYTTLEGGKNFCFSAYYINSREDYVRCVSPYYVAFNSCIYPYDGSWWGLSYKDAKDKHDYCLTLYEAEAYYIEENCICERNTCIISCYEAYPDSSYGEPYNPSSPPVDPPWPWSYSQYAYDSYSSSYSSS